MRDLVRRSEVLTGLAVRVAGRLQSVRDRRLSSRDRWSKRASDEARYWRDALRSPDAASGFADRLDFGKAITGTALRRALEELEATEISILDVGSGPLTSVAGTYPGKRIEVVAIDPLADEYVEILREAGIDAPVLPIACRGEQILEKYSPGTFDIAFIANALDHSADPLVVLENMLGVVKPAGRVVLWHLRNEGERNNYFGIHFWNIECRDGRFVIWNRETSHDVTALLSDRFDVECWASDGDRVNCLIRPRA